MFRYYESEDGKIRRFSFRKIYRMFVTLVDNEQKEQGTDFVSWLEEMEKNQILIREA